MEASTVALNWGENYLAMYYLGAERTSLPEKVRLLFFHQQSFVVQTQLFCIHLIPSVWFIGKHSCK